MSVRPRHKSAQNAPVTCHLTFIKTQRLTRTYNSAPGFVTLVTFLASCSTLIPHTGPWNVAFPASVPFTSLSPCTFPMVPSSWNAFLCRNQLQDNARFLQKFLEPPLTCLIYQYTACVLFVYCEYVLSPCYNPIEGKDFRSFLCYCFHSA